MDEDDDAPSAAGAWGQAWSISARARQFLAPPSTAVYSVRRLKPTPAHPTTRRQLSDHALKMHSILSILT